VVQGCYLGEKLRRPSNILQHPATNCIVVDLLDVGIKPSIKVAKEYII